MRSCGCFAHDGFQLVQEDLFPEPVAGAVVEGLTRMDIHVRLDNESSVSALVFDDELIDQQYRRFLDG